MTRGRYVSFFEACVVNQTSHKRYCVSQQDGGDHWGGTTAIVAPAGGAAESIRYSKSSSLYLWLLGYEFTGTFVYTLIYSSAVAPL